MRLLLALVVFFALIFISYEYFIPLLSRWGLLEVLSGIAPGVWVLSCWAFVLILSVLIRVFNRERDRNPDKLRSGQTFKTIAILFSLNGIYLIQLLHVASPHHRPPCSTLTDVKGLKGVKGVGKLVNSRPAIPGEEFELVFQFDNDFTRGIRTITDLQVETDVDAITSLECAKSEVWNPYVQKFNVRRDFYQSGPDIKLLIGNDPQLFGRRISCKVKFRLLYPDGEDIDGTYLNYVNAYRDCAAQFCLNISSRSDSESYREWQYNENLKASRICLLSSSFVALLLFSGALVYKPE